jgi:hypothetical protein
MIKANLRTGIFETGQPFRLARGLTLSFSILTVGACKK